MAHQAMTVEDIEDAVATIEEISGALSRIAKDMRTAEMSEVDLQFSYYAMDILPKILKAAERAEIDVRAGIRIAKAALRGERQSDPPVLAAKPRKGK